MTSPDVPKDDDARISFHFENIDFDFSFQNKLIPWIERIVEKETAQLQAVSFIFCTDDYLHELNVEYLDHDTLTDIITFPYTAPPIINGDVFISIDRVRENAATYQTSFQMELCRVIIHGVLHLCGYADKTPEEKNIMRRKENEALELLIL